MSKDEIIGRSTMRLNLNMMNGGMERMSKDEIIGLLIQGGHDPDRVRREVGLAEVAWKVEPDGWEVSDLWFLRARISESDPATVRE